MTDMQIAVRHDADRHRFVADIDGEESDAVMKYRRVDDQTLDYYSTYTPDELRGRGIAGEIVTTALDFALEQGLRVVPSCPYVARVIDRDPRYAGLRANP